MVTHVAGPDAVFLLFYGFKALSLWLRRPARSSGLTEATYAELASLVVQVGQNQLWLSGDNTARPEGDGGMDELLTHEAYADGFCRGVEELGVEEPYYASLARLSADRDFLGALRRAGGAEIMEDAKRYCAKRARGAPRKDVKVVTAAARYYDLWTWSEEWTFN
jgi:hypothetical protein